MTTMLEPFKIDVEDDVLDDLARRLTRTRWLDDDAETWEDGASPTYLHKLVDFWRDDFDWRAQETLLNRFAHYRAMVDGTHLHFIHEKARGPRRSP